LRVFVSNTAHDQAWQLEHQEAQEDGVPKPGPSSSNVKSGSPTKPAASAVAQTSDTSQSAAPSGNVEMGDVASIGAPVTEVVVTEVVKPLVPKEMQLGKEVDVNTGKGIPGWVLRVEGRVLDVSWSTAIIPIVADQILQSGNTRLDKSKRKLSSFLRSAVIEFDNREPPTFPEGNIVEVELFLSLERQMAE